MTSRTCQSTPKGQALFPKTTEDYEQDASKYHLTCEECRHFKNIDTKRHKYRTGRCKLDGKEVGKIQKLCKDYEPMGGIVAWLPDEFIECQKTGKPYKCDEWYLAMGEAIHKLSEVTLKLTQLFREKENNNDNE